MHKRQKATLISICMALAIGAGLLLPFSARAEEEKFTSQRPTGVSVSSGTTAPMSVHTPSFFSPPKITTFSVTKATTSSSTGLSFLSLEPTTLSSGATISSGGTLGSIITANAQPTAQQNVISTVALSPASGSLQTPAPSGSVILKAGSPAQLTSLTTLAVSGTASSVIAQLSYSSAAATQQVLGSAVSEGASPLLQAQISSSTTIIASATASAANAQLSSYLSAVKQAAISSVTSSGAVNSKLFSASETTAVDAVGTSLIIGMKQPQMLFPAHSIDNVLSLPSHGSFSQPESYAIINHGNKQNIGVESKKSEATIEVTAEISDKNSLKAGNSIQNIKKSLKTQVKESIAAGKVVCQKNKESNEKIKAELSSFSESLANRSKTALVDFIYNVKTSLITFEQIKDKNKDIAKKALPILKQLVLNKLFDSIPANDTVDTVFFTYPAPVTPSKDPLDTLPAVKQDQSIQQNHPLFGIALINNYNLNPGPIREITQFIDYLKPINDHLVQNGLSPPVHRLYSRIRTSSLCIPHSCLDQTALILDRTSPVYRFALSPFALSSSLLNRNRSCLLRYSCISYFHTLFSLPNHSLVYGYPPKPMFIGFLRFWGLKSTAGIRTDNKGGVR